jgi:hypothetical protein
VLIPFFAYQRKERVVIHTAKSLSTPFLTLKINGLCFCFLPRGSKTSLQVYFYSPVDKVLVSFYKPVSCAAHFARDPHPRQPSKRLANN